MAISETDLELLLGEAALMPGLRGCSKAPGGSWNGRSLRFLCGGASRRRRGPSAAVVPDDDFDAAQEAISLCL